MIKLYCNKAFAILTSLLFISIIVSFGIIFVIAETNVVTQSNALYSRENILIFSGINQDRFFFSSSEEIIEKRILAHDDDKILSEICVKKEFPNKIEIIITEKTPLFVVCFDQGYILTDKSLTMSRELLPGEEIRRYILIEGIENITKNNYSEKLAGIREINELLIQNGIKEEEMLESIECIVYDGTDYNVIFRNTISIKYSTQEKDIQAIIENIA